MTPPTLRFLIIEDDDFIARDMAIGLRNARPDAQVVTVRHNAELHALVDGRDDFHVFITGDRLSEIDASGLADLASSVRGEIVVREGLDSNEAVRARGYHSLPAPFTDSALLSVTEVFRAYRAA